MAKPSPIEISDRIANQLSGLFRELAKGVSVSQVAGVSLADADAFRRAVRLYILQCDSDDLTLVSTYRRCWIADENGLEWVEKWPLSQELVRSERFMTALPYVRFSTDDSRVRFGMRFGPNWYVTREGPPRENGTYDPTELSDPCPGLG